MEFNELGLIEPLLRAVAAEGYTHPTPIQAQSIPHLLAGKDLLGLAQTGTGKTAAFALPMLQRLQGNRRAPIARNARALVITPTRELALQIDASFRAYGKHLRLAQAVVFGGVGQGPQVQALARGVDVLVATPGRLMDLMEQGHIVLGRLEVLVLDEADRMLDMGFIADIRAIVAKVPPRRQTLLFSATMPPDIASLAASLLVDPVRVQVNPVSSTVDTVEQRVLFVETSRKRSALAGLLADPAMTRALVFTRTKHGANRVAEHLDRMRISANAIHSNKSQNARQYALEQFRAGRVRVLVATDIAARGIDVDGISHVINFDIPNVAETYVHRIGRTARAGAAGVAISLCDGEERAFLRDIEKLIGQKLVPWNGASLAGAAAESQAPRAAASHRRTPAPAWNGGSHRNPASPQRHGTGAGHAVSGPRLTVPRATPPQSEGLAG
ncbi:MAG TPA: DEAD/DEAH box helicase, partial [bacterium]|nr:DEAD/DEAH box helicase [bacterium]